MDANVNQLWHVKKIETEWVSDGIGDDFKNWRHFGPVLLSAQTGRGKNHFIMRKLIPYAVSTGQQVFLFSNRIALNVQQKKELLDVLHMPNVWSDEDLRNVSTFGLVTVLSYQQALHFFSRYDTIPIGGNPSANRSGCGYAVFDEAHFFLSDALFNSNTQVTFERLVQLFLYYTRIYMTATPYDIDKIVAYYENANKGKNTLTYYDMRERITGTPTPVNQTPDLCIYEFKRDYSNYKIKFFSDVTHLYDEIKRASPTNKWLLFVNDKHRQQEIVRELKLKHSVEKIDCFDSSKRSDIKLWTSLIDGNIPRNILLTTSVLDNGVNITDPGLHNVMIECMDRVTLTQMIGRKRVKGNEVVNLYIQSPPKDKIKDRYLECSDLMSVINEYKANPQGFLQWKWNDLHKKYRNLFWVNSNQQLVLNIFAEVELQHKFCFYGNLLYELQKTDSPRETLDIYPKQVLSWLELPQDINWVNAQMIEDATTDLLALLEAYKQSGIPDEKHKEFFSKFAHLVDTIYSGTETVPKDPRSGPSIMNKYLEKLEPQLKVSYKIEGKGTWRILKV